MTDNGINLHFSHEVEQLAEQLSDNVTNEMSQALNLLQPSHVIVPNANMQRYLQLFIAEKEGICANLEFPFLEKGLSQYLNFFEPEDEVPLWSQAELSIKIYAFLSTPELMADSTMQLIDQYVNSQNNELLKSRKKWQLARRLSVLFVSYELQRPEMVMHWVSDQFHFYSSQDLQLKRIEAAERFIYQNIMRSNTQAGSNSLFHRFQMIDWSEAKKTGQSMHLFTPTRLSAFHRHLLVHLAQYLPVHIYQLNVCSEYWEDMTTDSEDAWLKRLNAQPVYAHDSEGQVIAGQGEKESEIFLELGDENIENPLLKAWAKPGRESLCLFSQLEDDAIGLNVAYQPDWLHESQSRNQKALHVVQDSILTRTHPENALKETAQLKTLQLAVAPSMYREVQAIYNSVLINLQQNDDLKLTDIAILVPDMGKYRCVIEQVFAEQNKQHPFQLRYSLIDSSVKTESLYAQAVLGMFDVLEHDFMRAVVFKWLANDCVKQALKLTNEELAQWLEWLSHLGVYSHFDHLYATAKHDSTVQTELSNRFTWQQGLQRLRQSLVNEDVIALTQDNDLMGRLTWVIESLHQWHQILQKPKYPKEWQQLITQMTTSFVEVPEELYKEEQVRQALSVSLNKLVEHAGQVLMSLADIRFFIDQEFIHLSASKGNYLSGGLVCASLQPMRPIPFKITYILGLDERSFPGELQQETLDLTQRSRRLGDINRVENMNYLFLETLMCSREKLYLSYVGQDLIKGESILPSSTWQQLHNYLTSMIDAQSLGIKSYPVTRIPLDSAELYQFDANDIKADWLVNFAPNDHQKYSARYEHNSVDFGNDKTIMTVGKPTIEIVDEEASQVHIQVQALAKFFENPVLSYLDQVGASSQLINDVVNIEHEPFQLDGLSRYQLFDASVVDYLEAMNEQQPISLASAIDHQYDQMSKQSKLPIHLFAELDKLYELEQHKTFISLQTELKTLKALSGPVVFGDGQNHTTPALQVSAIPVRNSHFFINGTWEGLYATDGIISHQVVVSSSSGKSNRWSKHLIKPFVFWCLAQLDDQVDVAEYFQLRVVFRDQVNKYVFKPWSTGEISFSTKSEIRTYLLQVISAFNQPAMVNLPFDTINSLMVGVDERDQFIPYLAPSSKAKSIHVFALEKDSLTQYEQEKIEKKYQEKANAWIETHGYYEMLKALDIQFDPDALATYRERLLPLHVMTTAKLI